jgi:hypothetical protein
MKSLTWVTLLFALSLTACDKKKDDDKPETKKSSVQRISDADIDKADIPVPANFETKARATVNETNVEQQLDALEKQINEDK